MSMVCDCNECGLSTNDHLIICDLDRDHLGKPPSHFWIMLSVIPLIKPNHKVSGLEMCEADMRNCSTFYATWKKYPPGRLVRSHVDLYDDEGNKSSQVGCIPLHFSYTVTHRFSRLQTPLTTLRTKPLSAAIARGERSADLFS